MDATNNVRHPIEPSDRVRRVAYVAVQDRTARQRVVSVLERLGWAVIPQPSGFHLLQAIAGVIEGHQPWLHPDLIVVDARSRGCAGTTIAAGLRDLGLTIPIVLIAAPDEPVPVSPDRTLRIVDSASAEKTVTEIATVVTSTGPERLPRGHLAARTTANAMAAAASTASTRSA
jgi:CheY-like chemotaxis protein